MMCALIYVVAMKVWPSSLTQHKKDQMESLLWTWHPVQAGADFMTIRSTKTEDMKTFLPIVEGRPFLEHQPDGTVKQGASMGSDGIAISSDGSELTDCPLGRPQAL